VDNAWDADAENIDITLPTEMSDEQIIVGDDGTGMTEEELRSEYLKVARNRRQLKGDRTPGKRRQVRGRRGIGKFAGWMIAEQMEVVSRARGRVSSLLIDRTQINATSSDFEAIEIPFSSTNCDPSQHGTTVKLSHLNRRLSHPNAEKLRRILVLDYGRATDFKITVNGQLTTLHDISGEAFHSISHYPLWEM
jgi:HSP90 family molecular chaperone